MQPQLWRSASRSAGTQYYKYVIQSSGWRYGQRVILVPFSLKTALATESTENAEKKQRIGAFFRLTHQEKKILLKTRVHSVALCSLWLQLLFLGSNTNSETRVSAE